MKCLVCNREFKIINNFHLKSHNITITEYEKMFPNAKRYDPEVLKTIGEKARINQTGRKYSKDSRQKMSDTRKEKIASGKIITPFMTMDKSGDNNPAWGIKKRTYKQIEEHRNNQSKIMTKLILEGKMKYQYGKFYSEKTNIIISYRSSYELRFLNILESSNSVIDYKYESMKIKYIYKNQIRRYIPDFYVIFNTGEKVIIEVGVGTFKMYKDERTMRKHNAAINYCSKNNMIFVIITEKDLEILENMKNWVNCWDNLDQSYYNIIGNDKCDSIKNRLVKGLISSQAPE